MSSEEIHGPKHWKVKKSDGSRLEPANLDVLRHWVTSGQIEADDLVLNEEIANWISASEAVELADLFGKQAVTDASYAAQKVKPEPTTRVEKEEVEVPDCAFHPGKKAVEICVGCGKFICEACRERFEGKVHCRTCMAERNAGIEPGAPVGPAAAVSSMSGGAGQSSVSRLAIASLVVGICAFLVAVIAFVPRLNLTIAAVSGFTAFASAFLGWLALSRIRLGRNTLRGRPLALAGLVLGCVVFSGSLGLVFLAARSSTGGGIRKLPGSFQGVIPGPRGQQGQIFSKEVREEREANARQILEQARDDLGEDRLEQAVSACRTILGLYPETKTAQIVERRLPALEEALAAQKAEADALKAQNEQAAQTRFDHSLEMDSEGDHATALELLKSIINDYPDTEVAGKAHVEVARIEKLIAANELAKLDEKASQLAGQAEKWMESGKYNEAARLYRQIASDYSDTPTAARIKPMLAEAELLSTDPSEREFRALQKQLETKTYEAAIVSIDEFLRKYPESSHAAEAQEMRSQNQSQKNIADSLYNFGRAYFDEGKYNAALGRYNKLINEYPRSRWIPQAKQGYQTTIEKLRQ